MIARLTLTLVEWAVAAYAVALAASATEPSDLVAAGLVAIAAAATRSLAFSRTTGRRFDAMLEALRATRPSNRTGGL